jgi:hypothetical protein
MLTALFPDDVVQRTNTIPSRAVNNSAKWYVALPDSIPISHVLMIQDTVEKQTFPPMVGGATLTKGAHGAHAWWLVVK